MKFCAAVTVTLATRAGEASNGSIASPRHNPHGMTKKIRRDSRDPDDALAELLRDIRAQLVGNHFGPFSACIHDTAARLKTAREIHRQWVAQNGASPYKVRVITRYLEHISDSRVPLHKVFGAAGHVFSVALIWPRAHGERLAGEIHCSVPRCSSWTAIDLPEVLFLPNAVIGRGGDLLDLWSIEYCGRTEAHCPLHRHHPFWRIPLP